jgi:hypothetical protein
VWLIIRALGVYLRLLNLPNHAILVHPYVVGVVGDEPGIKEMIGFRTGGCTFFCTQCLFRNGDEAYNKSIHKQRDFKQIKDMCKIGERALARRTRKDRNQRPTGDAQRREFAAYKALNQFGIYPMKNAFHDAPMGYW